MGLLLAFLVVCMNYDREFHCLHYCSHCDVASALWNAIFTSFGLSWVMPRSVINLFACWWKSERPRSDAI
jgi:hypothetical protein